MKMEAVPKFDLYKLLGILIYELKISLGMVSKQLGLPRCQVGDYLRQ